MHMLRQGDILLVPVTIPVGRKQKFDEKEGIIVAEGEATGHHHRVKTPGVTYHTIGNRRFIKVPKGVYATLTHEEHDPLTIPSGTHEIVNQREYVAPKATDNTRVQRVQRVFD